MTTNSIIQSSRIASLVRWIRIQRLFNKFIIYGILMVLSAFILLPVGWMLTVALTPDHTPVFSIPPKWFPSEYWEWENFARVWTNPIQPFFRYTRNTLIIVTGNIFGTVLSSSLVAYAFARFRFRGSNLLFNLLIITMLIPWQVMMIPQFLMFFKIGWYGTYLPLIIPSFAGAAFYIFLIRQYMRTFPKDLDDAARIDGAGFFQIYWKIILPMSKPVLTVVAVLTYLDEWNDLLGPLIYLDQGRKFTLAIGVANMATSGDPSLNLVMAANLIMMIPPILLYFFAQEYLIGGIASMGLKG
ncbi:MAG: carbohydrate ABC transporter permease [Chloroflexi bacterium]|nr:carbohydrate ABC transporter permease [Chloroflexota bacterium]